VPGVSAGSVSFPLPPASAILLRDGDLVVAFASADGIRFRRADEGVVSCRVDLMGNPKAMKSRHNP